ELRRHDLSLASSGRSAGSDRSLPRHSGELHPRPGARRLARRARARRSSPQCRVPKADDAGESRRQGGQPDHDRPGLPPRRPARLDSLSRCLEGLYRLRWKEAATPDALDREIATVLTMTRTQELSKLGTEE